MYCTGGVRCEMASALIRRQVDADATGTEILQLSGGIERYLQAYPQGDAGVGAREGKGEGAEAAAENAVALGGAEGRGRGRGHANAAGKGGPANSGGAVEEGFFRGKNFVFDER